MKKLLLALCILVFCSCGKQSSNSTLADDSGKVKFEWDFSKQRTFVYSFSQTTNGESKLDKDYPAEKADMTVNGYLNIKVKAHNLADLSFTDVKMSTVLFDTQGSPTDTVTNEMPITAVQDMRPDGSFRDTNSDLTLDILFPLPRKNIGKGESDQIPMQMYMNAGATRLSANGSLVLTFMGYEEVDSVKCAVFKGDIDVSQLDVPIELKEEYHFSTEGKATYYFDPENGYYIGADINMTSKTLINDTLEGRDSFNIYQDQSYSNTYKMRLARIEE
ncbi:MAG: hypothetical protein AAFX87_27305 [Bacteroidota bacterium]